MKKNILTLICYLLRWSGLVWFLRDVYAKHKVTIINYHDPNPEIFAAHVRYFANHYSFISIGQIVNALEQHDFSNLPPKPLLVTFDDGYAGNALLFPVLRRYRIPAVIYAVAGVVDTQRHFWFDKLAHHGDEMEMIKKLPDDERREQLRTVYNHWDEKEYDMPVALSRKELEDFVSLGGTIGSHTLFHPLLDRCQDDDGIRECGLSRKLLESFIGQPVVHFALPNGNGNEKVLKWIRFAGYRSCRTTTPGWVIPGTSPYCLPVFGITDSATPWKAAIQACGLWAILKGSLNFLRSSK